MKVIIFDLDLTLIDEDLKPFPDVKTIIRKLSTKYKLAIASYNDEAEYILKQHDLLKYFDIVVGIYYFTKDIHFSTIKKHFNIDYSDMCFFDDLEENIELAKSLGISSYLVDYQIGVTLTDISRLI